MVKASSSIVVVLVLSMLTYIQMFADNTCVGKCPPTPFPTAVVSTPTPTSGSVVLPTLTPTLVPPTPTDVPPTVTRAEQIATVTSTKVQEVVTHVPARESPTPKATVTSAPPTRDVTTPTNTPPVLRETTSPSTKEPKVNTPTYQPPVGTLYLPTAGSSGKVRLEVVIAVGLGVCPTLAFFARKLRERRVT